MAQQVSAPAGLLPALGRLLGASPAQADVAGAPPAGRPAPGARSRTVLLVVGRSHSGSGLRARSASCPRMPATVAGSGDRVLLGAAERARFTVAQDVAMLLETGDGTGLLQRVARLVPSCRRAARGPASLSPRMASLPSACSSWAISAAGDHAAHRDCGHSPPGSSSWRSPELLGLLLPLLLRLGQTPLPLLLLHSCCCCCNRVCSALPVVALLLPCSSWCCSCLRARSLCSRRVSSCCSLSASSAQSCMAVSRLPLVSHRKPTCAPQARRPTAGAGP